MEQKFGASEKDVELLKQAMFSLGAGDFSSIEGTEFDDPSLAEAFNEMLEGIVDRNNRFLARLNDAQVRIGDSACVRDMFEVIEAKQDTMSSLKNAKEILEGVSDKMDAINLSSLALARQIKNTFNPCLEELKRGQALAEGGSEMVGNVANSLETLTKLVEMVRIPDKESENAILYKIGEMLQVCHNEEKNNEIEKRSFLQTRDYVEGIEQRTKTIIHNIDLMSEEMYRQLQITKSFVQDLDATIDSFSQLSVGCVETGRYLYRISRDIDNARNDLYRQNSRPTMHDRLRIFEVDHLTLLWRIYNHLVEFESLRLDQVNRPNNCKFGVWVQGMQTSDVAKTEAFQKAVEAHLAFHESAISCYEAKATFDMEGAKQEFVHTIETFERFKGALTELHNALDELGITEQTPIWVFQGL